jgi:3-dehydroquinate synthase
MTAVGSPLIQMPLRQAQGLRPTTTLHQHIDVSWEFPVVFTHYLFAPENGTFASTLDRLHEGRRHRAIVFVDQFVAQGNPALAAEIIEYFRSRAASIELVGEPRVVPGGEAIKNDFKIVEGFMRLLLEERLDRHSYVICVGGGAVLDAVGLAAALVHRGLRLVRVPTTVLAQNDAGVGVKNGVNFLGGKNAIGTFAPPFAVLNDFMFLTTLPDRDWLNGVAEAFKVAIIRDRAFFESLCAQAERYPARDFEAMQQLVVRCAEMHLEHIRTNGDPFEYGRARPLDFGHWSAHKLELISGFRISHGEAVAAGVLLDSIYAQRKGWITADELAQIRSGLQRSGFQLWFPEFDLRTPEGERAIFGGLRDFQEHLGGELCVTYPRGIGARFEVHEIDLALMEAALQELSQVAASHRA